MGRDLNAGHAFLTEANRRAISKNLDRIYPIDHQPIFADLLAGIEAVEQKSDLRKR